MKMGWVQVILVMVLLSVFAFAIPTPSSILVHDCNELQNMNLDLTAKYELANDIDCSETVNWNDNNGFLPIGGPCTNAYVLDGNEFTGTLDGKNYSINNLTINNLKQSQGLFGSLSGTITNLDLKDINFNTSGLTGGLAACAKRGTVIDEVTVSGTMFHNFMQLRMGGLIGVSMADSITDSSTDVEISTYYGGAGMIGGLIGEAWDGDITNCYAKGDVNVLPTPVLGDTSINSTLKGVGGLIGRIALDRNNNYIVTISDCYATGDVTGHQYVGGLVGLNEESTNVTAVNKAGATITRCYATGNVEGTKDLGGLIGYNDGEVSESFATGNVYSIDTNKKLFDYVGALIGYNWGHVNNTFATGTTSGYNSVSSLVAHNPKSIALNNNINNSYSIGQIDYNRLKEGTVNSTGSVGTVSYSYDSSFKRRYAYTLSTYFDVNSTTYKSQPDGNATAYADASGAKPYSAYHGIPRTTVQMLDQANYAGWDFDEIWEFSEVYPTLRGIDVDLYAPVLKEITPVVVLATNTNPEYVFNSSEAGKLTSDCDINTDSALKGNNSISFVSLSDGNYNCTLTVTDSADKIGTLSVSFFQVDTKGPVIAHNVEKVYYNSDVNVILTVTDAISDINSVIYSINDVNSNYADNILVTTDGNTVITVYAFDELLNESTLVISFVIDRNAPIISSTSSVTQTLATISTTSDEFTFCQLRTDNNWDDFVADQNGTIFNWTVDGLSSGTSYTRYVLCRDNSGNNSVETITFTTTSPAPNRGRTGGGTRVINPVVVPEEETPVEETGPTVPENTEGPNTPEENTPLETETNPPATEGTNPATGAFGLNANDGNVPSATGLFGLANMTGILPFLLLALLIIIGLFFILKNKKGKKKNRL
jgi:hypothetical protein